MTIDQLLAGVVDDHISNARPVEGLRGRMRNHLLPFFSGWRAADVRTDDIKRYARARLEESAKPATINRELAALRRGYNLAYQAQTLFSKPHIPMLAENNARTGFFEREQFEAVRRCLPEEIRAIVTFAYVTAWRVNSEILSLQWSRVDFRAGVGGSKSAARRTRMAACSRSVPTSN